MALASRVECDKRKKEKKNIPRFYLYFFDIKCITYLVGYNDDIKY